MPALPLRAVLLTLGLSQAPVAAIGSGVALHSARAKDRSDEAGAAVPFAAQIFTDLSQGGTPPKQKEVELLRFVTAYRTGLEAVVDATPYAPLLRSAAADAARLGGAAAQGNLTFYAFIDTWVNNGTGRDVLYMNNVTGQCSTLRKSDGNGWSLHLDLLLWPRTSVDTRPRESVTLASGFYGANYNFGDISLAEGQLVQDVGGAAVLLDPGADFKNVVGNPPVYECPNGAGDLQTPSLLGYAAQQASFLAKRHGPNSEESKAFADNLLEMLVYSELAVVNVTGVFNATSSVLASYDPKQLQPTVGMPVFYEELDVFTDTELSTMWLNMTYPFNKSGEVLSINNGTMVIGMMHPCLPRGDNFGLPRLIMPKNSSQIPDTQALVDSVMRWAKRTSANATPAASIRMLGAGLAEGTLVAEPLLLEPQVPDAVAKKSPLAMQELSSLRLLGRLDPSAGAVFAGSPKKRFPLLGQPPASGNATRSCVVQRRRQGRLFARDFTLGKVLPGDHVVLQLTVTGHGWARTTEQCGEYCHAVYHLTFGGQSVANISEFRDDCGENPINGSMQFGTWNEKRNGWCPGTVEPGFFMDVTQWVKEGKNHLDFDVTVWNNKTAAYEAYTDYAGFAYGDQALLTVALSLFVYDAAAVAAVRSAGVVRSAAEAALLAGSSEPSRLRPRRLAGANLAASVLLERDTQEFTQLVQEAPAAHERRAGWGRRVLASPLGGAARLLSSAVAPDAGEALAERARVFPGVKSGFDFEARAPWYQYNQTVEGYPGINTGAVTVPIFSGALVQGASRTVHASVSAARLAAVDWGQAALYLRLTKPPGKLEYDHWDRVGSLGLLVDGARVVDGTPGP